MPTASCPQMRALRTTYHHILQLPHQQKRDTYILAIGSTIPTEFKRILQALLTKADLQGMPTKADLDAVAARIEKSLRREIEDVRQQTSTLDSKVCSLEQTNSVLDQRVTQIDQRVTHIEGELTNHNHHLVECLLQTDDLENRNRRNNIKLRGIPESISPANLMTSATATNIRNHH